MKKKPEMKSMSNLGIAHVWPEMAYGKNWEDVPITMGYEVTDKGREELERWHQRKRAWKFIAICLVFIILGVIYIYIR